MATWSQSFFLEFLELFRSHPALWKVKSKLYYDRRLKDRSYEVLIRKLRTIDPTATRVTVLKKINNIRSCFRKELKKVRQSKRNNNPDEIYKPRLWYYEKLLFLVNQEEDNKEVSDSDDTSDNKFSEESQEPRSIVKLKEISTPISCTQPQQTLSNVNSASEITRSNDLRSSDRILTTVEERVVQVRNEDKFDTFGRNVAAKLRSLVDNEQRIFAERLINDALSEAELGSLYRSSRINSSET